MKKFKMEKIYRNLTVTFIIENALNLYIQIGYGETYPL